MHIVAAAREYVPARQVEQLSPGPKDPAGQGWHEVLFLNVPGEQEVAQAVDPAAENFPLGQAPLHLELVKPVTLPK